MTVTTMQPHESRDAAKLIISERAKQLASVISEPPPHRRIGTPASTLTPTFSIGEVYIRVPITCPVCLIEMLEPLRAAGLLDSLSRIADLRLSVRCHNVAWYATSDELEHIRDYLRLHVGTPVQSENSVANRNK